MQDTYGEGNSDTEATRGGVAQDSGNQKASNDEAQYKLQCQSSHILVCVKEEHSRSVVSSRFSSVPVVSTGPSGTRASGQLEVEAQDTESILRHSVTSTGFLVRAITIMNC